MVDELAADDAQQFATALQTLGLALENTLGRFRASFDAVGFSPRVVEYLEATVCLQLADRKLETIETSDPTQRPRCMDMVAELLRRRSALMTTSDWKH